jgi:tellurite resistance protein
MEALFYMFLIFIGYSVVINIVGAGARAVGRGVKKVVTGKETYLGPGQLKLEDVEVEDEGIVVKKIMYRGKIPVSRSMTVGYSVSALDVTDGDDNVSFIISMMEQQQEPDTVCFGIFEEIGNTDVGDTYTDWVQLAAMSPEYIQCPKSGSRKIRLVVRFFNAEDAPSIRAGIGDGGELIFCETLDFEHLFIEKGYEETAKNREESQQLSLKIGVAVAMADGTLDDSEGEILKSWIIKEVSPFSDEKSERLKKLFNDALKEGFAQAQSGNLALSPLVERLSEIGEKKTKYDAIGLAFDVMAADGVADPEEMAVIRNVARALDLDMDEIEKMRESVTLDLSVNLTSDHGLEALVGIEEGWSDDQKKKHLRSEFQKWSNRLNSLSEGEERESAQNMLDNIASLRKQYG